MSPPQHVHTETPRRVRRGVIGLLVRDGHYLMIRRALGVTKGGTWCFPGGHVERGETSRVAIQREMAEELGVEVRPTQRLGSIRVTDSRHVLVVWRVDHVQGDFRPAESEIADFRWVPIDQIVTITPGLASNASVRAMLRE